jgi:hypothetical protein
VAGGAARAVGRTPKQQPAAAATTAYTNINNINHTVGGVEGVVREAERQRQLTSNSQQTAGTTSQAARAHAGRVLVLLQLQRCPPAVGSQGESNT